MRFLLFVLLFANTAFAVNLPSQGACDAVLQAEDISASVASAEDLAVFLKQKGQDSIGTHLNYILTFHDGTQWIFKDSGPDGFRSWEGEVGAYRLAQLIDNDRVPETLFVSYQGRTGSLQRFLGMSRGLEKDELAEVLKRKAQDLSEVEIIQYLAGQWDRHPGNIFISEDDRIYAIDNEASASHTVWQIGDYPFRHKGRNKFDRELNFKEFPFESVQSVPYEDLKSIAPLLKEYISLHWISILFEKHTRKKAPLNYIIWQGGIWIQHLPSSLPVVKPLKMKAAQVKKLQALNEKKLRAALPAAYDQQHIQEILFRRDLLLKYDSELKD